MSKLLGIVLYGADFTDLSDKVKDLYSQLMGPLIAVLVGAAVLLGLWLGSKFLLAGGDEQKVKKAKESVKYFVTGIIVIFVVAALVPLAVGALQGWMAG